MSYQWHDLVGNLGVILIVGTFFLLQIDKLSNKSTSYSVLNALGAVLVLVSLMVEFNLSAFIIEIFWLIISIIGLVYRFMPQGRKSPQSSSELASSEFKERA